MESQNPNYTITFSETGVDEILQQLERRNFRDLKSYRVYQKSILMEKGWEEEYLDIDFLIAQDESLPRPEKCNPKLPDDENIIQDQLLRASEKMVEEYRSHERLLDEIERRINMDETPETDTNLIPGNRTGERYTETPSYTESPESTRNPESSIRKNQDLTKQSFKQARNNLKPVKTCLESVPEETGMDYAEPLEQL